MKSTDFRSDFSKRILKIQNKTFRNLYLVWNVSINITYESVNIYQYGESV